MSDFPDEEVRQLIRNSVVCVNCVTEIESTHRHDFVGCDCWENSTENKGIAIDGGLAYTKLTGRLNGYIWTGMYEDENKKENEKNRQFNLNTARAMKDEQDSATEE